MKKNTTKILLVLGLSITFALAASESLAIKDGANAAGAAAVSGKQSIVCLIFGLGCKK